MSGSNLTRCIIAHIIWSHKESFFWKDSIFDAKKSIFIIIIIII